MNQDFVFVATPATARRLLLLQGVCKIEITDEIRRLAEQDCLPESLFDPLVCPYDIVKYTVGQFLLDCDLRAVIQVDYHPEINPIFVLNIARLIDPERIVIVSERRRMWHNAATALNLGVDIGSSWLLETADRRAVVIYDPEEGLTNPKMCQYMREFAHFVIFQNHQGFDRLVHWSHWASLLFPSMPHPLLPRLLRDVPTHWQSQAIVAFAPLYNTCIFPHLSLARLALQDSYVQSRLKYMSLLSRL